MNLKTVFAAFALVSCGPPDVTDEASPSASSSAVACEARCEAKLVGCRATVARARPACASECAAAISDSALGCLERASCTAVMTASSWAGLCSTGAGGGRTTGSGSATGGGGAGSGMGGGAANAAMWPETVTLRGSIGTQRVSSTVTNSGAIGTNFSFNGAVQRAPSNAPIADLAAGTLRVVSPSFGGCTQLPVVSWNASGLSLVITTLDPPGSSDCKRAVTALASGARLEVQRATYPGSGGRSATVTIELSR